MSVISMKQLLEAGVHFGHQTRRWNPKMAQYIFTERNGIYIIDLQKTVKKVEEAYNFIREVSTEGKDILFVGTKKQACPILGSFIRMKVVEEKPGGNKMSVISMKQLLEAGVHFGHQTRRWNPKMAPYIFTERNGIYIIDLQKTVKKVEEAYNFIREVSTEGKDILFVGTKKQAQEAIQEEAVRSNMHFVNNRWLGGMLTNFKTIKTRIKRLEELQQMEQDGTFDVLPKKEVIKLKGEMEKLQTNLGGITNLDVNNIGAMFVVDPRKEKNAISEAKILGIPVVAIVDTNCDPEEVDYVIPGNDDAIRAVKLITAKLAMEHLMFYLRKK